MRGQRRHAKRLKVSVVTILRQHIGSMSNTREMKTRTSDAGHHREQDRKRKIFKIFPFVDELANNEYCKSQSK